MGRPFKHTARFGLGFTLLEMLIVIFILGILIVITDLGKVLRLNDVYYRAKQEANNKNIVAGLMQYAKTNTALGTLPTPYTGGSYHSAILDPTNTALAQLFRATNIPPSEINDDGSGAANVRVYQVVSLTEDIPMDFQSGPLVTIAYQYGEIHQTACALSAACNAGPLPGASAALTSSNYKTWTSTAPDLPATMFSTRELQKQMLTATSARLAMIRDQAIARVNVRRLAADAADTTNWYPYPFAAGVPGTPNPNLSGSNATTNQGCWDGWYNLSASNVNVLPQIGLAADQYGTTAWGAQIEYCRDYDPTGRGANSLPHHAALRINRNVSQGIAPGGTTASNLFISF